MSTVSETLEVRPAKLTEKQIQMLQSHLAIRVPNYSRITTIFHVVYLWGSSVVGVIGDGGFGTYEWFYVAPEPAGRVNVSDKGYGDDAIALREVLNLYVQ